MWNAGGDIFICAMALHKLCRIIKGSFHWEVINACIIVAQTDQWWRVCSVLRSSFLLLRHRLSQRFIRCDMGRAVQKKAVTLGHSYTLQPLISHRCTFRGYAGGIRHRQVHVTVALKREFARGFTTACLCLFPWPNPQKCINAYSNRSNITKYCKYKENFGKTGRFIVIVDRLDRYFVRQCLA